MMRNESNGKERERLEGKGKFIIAARRGAINGDIQGHEDTDGGLVHNKGLRHKNTHIKDQIRSN